MGLLAKITCGLCRDQRVAASPMRPDSEQSFGASRPNSYFTALDQAMPPPSEPHKPSYLRPLRLVEMQQARQNHVPPRGSSLRHSITPRPPPAPPSWPTSQEFSRMDQWRSVDVLWEAPEGLDEPLPAPVRPAAPPLSQASRRSVHYDVNDRMARARAARQAQALPTPQPVPLTRAQTLPAPPSELPYLLPPPRPEMRRALTDEEQHDMAVAALRAQGSWLPDLLQQARRGHVLTIPPHVQAQGQARTAALEAARAQRPSPDTAPASGPRGR